MFTRANPWRIALRGLSRASSSNVPLTNDIRSDLRALLRETAQPVAVVTSLMPTQAGTSLEGHNRFHGATLSSFSSISMDPHPLVAFSLRIPSRMATALNSADADSPLSHLVINILSAAQASIAVRFSRPDLHSQPFASTPYLLTDDGLPVLEGCLGALSCKLVGVSWPLHDLHQLKGSSWGNEKTSWEGEGAASELFIAQVTKVEQLSTAEEGRECARTTPLLYYRRSYATTCDISSQESIAKKS
ncbi:hypothetical protein OBBRIDRAFT_743850 [Obba rivulosa]|uniref:Flavin reductase like domain-containing protein n=1 Tax=Obba rivulosa TaxID=1052685 RepID=A0A8E2DVE9_9APHY|nr:hypothetical protein OBBRIDRAFT_743850 [Obba rivulosa]